jgi:hypothetical protein
MSTGGSLETISINSREFSVAADADTQRKLGGFENENAPNGDGTARQLKTRVTWKLSGLTLDVDDDRDDHQFLQDIADAKGYFPISATYTSGAVFQGTGNIEGEMQYSNQNTLVSLDVGGPGKFTKQS